MQQKLTPSQETIMAALCYGQVFQFPLKLEEFSLYMPLRKVTEETLNSDLKKLVDQGRVIHQDGLYALPCKEDLFSLRREREPQLRAKWALIRQHLPRLFGHRFIKGVLLTGSLAAKNPDGRADADLFLVLDEKRLWISYLWIRLWCRLTKKGLFCPNYVLGHNHLHLSFPNYFTAVEYAMSVPLKWDQVWPQLERANPWLTEMLPNAKAFEKRCEKLEPKTGLLTRLLDLGIASPVGWVLDKLEWWRLKLKTKGVYTPNRWVYKPHSPHRQRQIFKKFLACMDAYDIGFTPFRQHIEAELVTLGKAQRAWDAIQSNTEKRSTEGPVAEVCSRNAN